MKIDNQIITYKEKSFHYIEVHKCSGIDSLHFCTIGASIDAGLTNENGVPRINRYMASTSGCISASD